MSKTILISMIAFVFTSNFIGNISLAAQAGKVQVDTANLYEQPQPDSTVIGTVVKDTLIAVSNVQTNGFFKARIPGGVVGWISGNDVLAGPGVVDSAGPIPTPIPKEGNASPVTQKTALPERKKRDDTVIDHSRVILSGGIQYLANSGFPSVIPVTGSQLSEGGALELQFHLAGRFHIAGRVDYFTGSSSQVVSGGTQTWSYHSIPVMAGIIYDPWSKSNFRLSVGAYLGAAFMNTLTLTQASLQPVTYSSTDLCEYLDVQFSYAVSLPFSILVEAGYHIETASFPAATSTAAIVAPAFKPNFSGPVGRVGVEFRF